MAEADEKKIPILSRLRAPAGATRPKFRTGRGPGSGLGKTGGRGQKGQKARNGGNIHKLAFEGGQMPLVRRIPKRGFKNLFAAQTAEVNIRDLNRFAEDTTVNAEALATAGLINGKFDRIKILGNGELERKLTVQADAFSAGARAKIEGAGGSAEVVPMKKPRVEAAPSNE